MKRAFTLIELLVVIAIIAILAAILFPVFAQAKAAAKNTALLSNAKQMATASIMYGGDYDDMFAPTMASQPLIAGDYGWQDLIQPYAKNYDLVLNPKRTAPPSDPTYLSWLRLQHFGMPARAATNPAAVTQGYFSGNHNGLAVTYDGIAGFVNLDPANGANADWLGRLEAPSLTQSQIEDVAGTCMLAESSNWDMWWSLSSTDTDPMGHCYQWNPPEANAAGAGNFGYDGPTATTQTKDGKSGLSSGCFIPDGRTTYVATDSSAHSVDMRANAYFGRESSSTPGTFIIKMFNPTGR